MNGICGVNAPRDESSFYEGNCVGIDRTIKSGSHTYYPDELFLTVEFIVKYTATHERDNYFICLTSDFFARVYIFT